MGGCAHVEARELAEKYPTLEEAKVGKVGNEAIARPIVGVDAFVAFWILFLAIFWTTYPSTPNRFGR